MKNVTITLEEEVARWARVWAAKHDTSVSRMLGEELRRKMEAEKTYQRSMKRFMAKEPRRLKARARKFARREELYER